MRLKFSVAMAVLVALSGCGAESDDCADPGAKNSPYIGEPMFNRCAGMGLVVDHPAYTAGDTLTLTISFEPLYAGVGELHLQFLPVESRAGQLGVSVTAPSMVSDSGLAFSGLVSMEFTGRLHVPVSFVVRDNTPYHIHAAVRFLQVRDPSTGQLMVVRSDEQIAALGPLDDSDYGTSAPLVLPRPMAK